MGYLVLEEDGLKREIATTSEVTCSVEAKEEKSVPDVKHGKITIPKELIEGR